MYMEKEKKEDTNMKRVVTLGLLFVVMDEADLGKTLSRGLFITFRTMIFSTTIAQEGASHISRFVLFPEEFRYQYKRKSTYAC